MLLENAGNAVASIIKGGEKSAIIGVETIMRSPGDYKGKINIEGVVRAVENEKKLTV